MAVSSIVLIVAAVAVFDAFDAGMPFNVRLNSLESIGERGITEGSSYALRSSTSTEVC